MTYVCTHIHVEYWFFFSFFKWQMNDIFYILVSLLRRIDPLISEMTQIWKCIGLPSTTLNTRDLLPVVWLPTLLSWTLSWYNISMGVFHNIYIVQGYTILLNRHFKKLSVCFCTTLIGWVFLIKNNLKKDFSKKKITLPELLRYNNKIIYDSRYCTASL